MTEIMPTDRELEALKILWTRNLATVRDVWQELQQSDQNLAYTTILSLMKTMEDKGLVAHEASGRAFAYYPLVERVTTFQNLAGRFLDKVFDGAMDEYLVRAMESRRPSAEELDRLERMIAEAKRRVGRPSE
jgi:BlaI family transcriptional regulator, penicillinase repressor